MAIHVVIPARLDSKRFPRKVLTETEGRSLLEWTYLKAESVLPTIGVFVASNDQEIIDHCNKRDIPVIKTLEDHWCGTSRVAEAARLEGFSLYDVVINWQADEPCVSSEEIKSLIKVMDFHRIATLISESGNEDSVKVAAGLGLCWWFSRSNLAQAYHHIGVYAFRNYALQQVAGMKQSKYSKAEDLEQLTWLENGLIISYAVSKNRPLSINTKADWAEFEGIEEKLRTRLGEAECTSTKGKPARLLEPEDQGD